MARSTRSTPRIPTTTLLRVIEDAPERLVVHIPGGGPRAGGLGCFALAWNLFMLCFTPPWIFAAVQGEDVPLWIIGPLLGLFWLIGLGMAYAWVRMRFTRYNLLVEPDRVVVQNTLFERKRIEDTRVDAGSTIELVERYRHNDTPVHAITVTGIDRTIRFGTALSEQDQRFLLHKIRVVTRLEEPTDQERQWLVRAFPESCSGCGAPLPQADADALVVTCPHCGRTHSRAAVSLPGARSEEDSLPFDDLEPSQLPADSLIEVDDSGRDRLELRYPAFSPKSRWVVAGVVAFVSLFAVMFLVVGFNVLVIVFGGAAAWLHAAGTLVLGAGIPALAVVACLRSSCRVSVDRERLQAQWKVGPLRFRRAIPLGEIRQVVLTQKPDDELTGDGGRRRGLRRGSYSEYVTCIVIAATMRVPLTSTHDLTTVRQVAGMIRGRLRKLGGAV